MPAREKLACHGVMRKPAFASLTSIEYFDERTSVAARKSAALFIPSRTSMRRETLRSAVVLAKVDGGPPLVSGAGVGAGAVVGRPGPAGLPPPLEHALTRIATHA